MFLSKAKTYAEDTSKQTINDCVITVPPYFTQAERRSLLLSAQLAKLKVLQLINSNAAFALNYGVFRRKDFNATPQNILFYNMGSSSTIVTISSYQLVKTKERGFTETNPQLTIKGIVFDIFFIYQFLKSLLISSFLSIMKFISSSNKFIAFVIQIKN
jgi:hypoxia up-regulated 1